MQLSMYSVGTYLETYHMQLVRQQKGHSHLSLLSHCGLILAKRVELVCTS